MPDFLLILLLAPHLAAVGFAGVAPLVALGLEWCGTRRGDDLGDRIARHLGRQAMLWLTAGIVLGGAALGVSWLRAGGEYFEAFRAFPARRYWFGLAELAVFYAALWGYVRWRPHTAAGRAGQRFLALFAGTNLLYHFPPLFAAVAVLAQRGSGGQVSFVSMLADREVLARVGHDLLAAATVTGVAVMLAARRAEFRAAGEPWNARIIRWGARIALPAALLQIPLGVVLLVVLPAATRQRLMGGDALAAVLLAAGLVAAFGLMHHLAGAALGACRPAEVRRAAGLLALTLLLMVAARQQSRAREEVAGANAGGLRPAWSVLR